MIILFIFVGLIYDWGGIKGHPGPVSDCLTREVVGLNGFRKGPFKLPKRTSIYRRIC